ncbi:MAG: hypothetical protein ACQSGP_21590, partial [Frankia sp.]
MRGRAMRIQFARAWITRGEIGRGRVVAVATATATIAVLVVGGGPAAASGRPILSAGPTQQVTVYLAAPDPSGLVTLAHTGGMSMSTRAARLARLLPQTGARVTVENRLRTLGLTVMAVSTWSVTATAPAGLIRALFGSARATRPDLPFAQGLPALPSALGRLVTAAVGGDEVRPAFQSFAHATARASTAPPSTPPAVGSTAGATSGHPAATIPAGAG